jgi:co-chaperonin GroES (HSP10)
MTTEVDVCGHRVLLKATGIDDEIQTGALKGFTFDVGDVHKMEKAATVVGYVAGVGPTAWFAFDKYLPNGETNPAWKPWAKVGDKVYFAKYAGKFVTINGETYILVNDEDIQAVIHEDAEVEDGS